ncbi:hypothetical protein [Latilactobacillus fragifolii]|uniref:hypothetical protein n=1 Tax=Latilactobacillus fragifolii TaxID=2814244 RepID=UPI001ABB8A18|nr:hypothetical protein [Latilactobacillus fragifolii]
MKHLAYASLALIAASTLATSTMSVDAATNTDTASAVATHNNIHQYQDFLVGSHTSNFTTANLKGALQKADIKTVINQDINNKGVAYNLNNYAMAAIEVTDTKQNAAALHDLENAVPGIYHLEIAVVDHAECTSTITVVLKDSTHPDNYIAGHDVTLTKAEVAKLLSLAPSQQDQYLMTLAGVKTVDYHGHDISQLAHLTENGNFYQYNELLKKGKPGQYVINYSDAYSNRVVTFTIK